MTASALFRIFLLLVPALQVLQVKAQDKQAPNALLWKITGNNLAEPSFLFGTIHLQDKRVFNFSDSLYSVLQQADGFAMEVHPDSMSLATKEDKALREKLLKKDTDVSTPRRKRKRRADVNQESLTVKGAYRLKGQFGLPAPGSDDMHTFVDAYLFEIAKKQGKEIAGLERASDQERILKEVRGEFDVSAIIKGLKKEKSIIERLIQLYIREDLNGIHELMSYLPDETEHKLLTLRNRMMVAAMESLIRSKSFVIAVGTAHLPGDKGMIELLREKGYTVEPVFTTSRTHANDYNMEADGNSY